MAFREIMNVGATTDVYVITVVALTVTNVTTKHQESAVTVSNLNKCLHTILMKTSVGMSRANNIW